MAFSLPFPAEWQSQEWKVKIFDDERNEEPHITVVRKVRMWRISLRSGEFLDEDPPRRDVPKELVEWVWGRRRKLRQQWDRMYPENPVFSPEDK